MATAHLASTVPVNASFDPFQQPVTLLLPDGRTTVTVGLDDFAYIQHLAVLQTLIQAVQVGAALMLLLVMLLVTKRDKRRSVVFLLNTFALVLIVVRGVLVCVVSDGPFYDFYRWSLQYYAHVGNAKAVSVSGDIMSLLLTFVIEASLLLQVFIVCASLCAPLRWAANGVNVLAALAAIGVKLAVTVLNVRWSVVHVNTESLWQFALVGRLGQAANISMTVSIGLSALIFTTKLGFAIHQRRSMGMTQFGPLQIIFIMGAQSMFTPFIFTVISYWAVPYVQMSSFVPTVVAVSLPLSGMWAAATPNNVQIAKPGRRKHHNAIPVGPSDLTSGRAYGSASDLKPGAPPGTGRSDTLVDGASLDTLDTSSEPKLTPRSNRFSAASATAVADVELRQMEEGVRVDRTFSVRSD